MIASAEMLRRLSSVIPMKEAGISTGELIQFVTPVVIYIICSVILLAVLPKERID
ncbi:MAG: hypothetical protein HYX92_13675 [Chloroflexi bacterium]|nr:hypothetical protein [Chloroflexota bacterium]